MPEIPRQKRVAPVSSKHGANFLENFQKSLEEAGRCLQQTTESRDDYRPNEGGLGCKAETAREQWISFARSTGDFRLTGNRSFSTVLEKINTLEEEELSLFAFSRSKSLDGTRLVEGLMMLKPRGASGSEHRVYLDENNKRVIKRTKSGKYGTRTATPCEYLDRLALMNKIYPALDNRFEDCVKNTEDQYSIISSMNWFPGPHPEGKEVDKFLKEAGFAVLDDGSGTMDYIHNKAGLILRDCHAQNWVIDRGLVPIDIIPEIIKEK